MTYKELNAFIASFGLPYAYNEFPNGTEQEPPFVCFLLNTSNDFLADDVNYQKIRELTIELYTDNKDFVLENTIETALTQGGFVYRRGETYLDSERMNMVIYTTNVIITEE
jgi:hypothetical protein